MIQIECRNISKSYSDVHACRNVSFQVRQNSIHALVGENGAGKSTLMKILGGLEQPTSGELFLRGAIYKPRTAKDAFHARIGFIHQHFLLAENLTVLDHLILNESGSKIFSRFKTQDLLKKVEIFAEKFKWSMDLHAKISQLSVGDHQRIEIIKALLADPEIIIFDEPTAVLAPQEILEFLKFLKQLQSEGKTILLISHKLNEIKNVADQLTVLRHGESIFTTDVDKISIGEIAEKMIGKKIAFNPIRKPADTVIEVLFNHKNILFKKSRILGVAGIEGHGQSQLIQSVLQTALQNKLSVADIPEDRLKYGVFPGLTLVDHMALRHHIRFYKLGFIQKAKAMTATENLLKQWDVRPPNSQIRIENLSGGNQQKFVIGRELAHDPEFIIAAHPTRGVDLNAQQSIHSAFLEQTANGKSIFLVSSDLDEILKLSDQLLILFKNQYFGPFEKNQLSEIEIGQFMTGSHPEQENHLLGSVNEI